MMRLRSILRVTLIVMTIFMAISAFAGGIGLIAGLNTPPLEELEGSAFKDYTIPGLALFFIVGGSALLSTILLIRKNKYAILCSIATGLIMIFFEFVEVLEFGSPPGIGRQMQVIYFGLGVLISAAALAISLVDLPANTE
jgi:hypothetical protein